MVRNYYKPRYLAAFAILFGITQMAHAQNPNLNPLIDSTSLTQDLTNSAQKVIGVLPVTDAAGITAAAARIDFIANEAEDLRKQSEETRTSQQIETMQTPAELNGLVTRTPSTSLAPGTYVANEKSFAEGNSLEGLALQFVEDYLVNSIDFFKYGDYWWSGICLKPSFPLPKVRPKEYYYFPLYGFEATDDRYRGRYLDGELVRETYMSFLEDDGERYSMMKNITPFEINRTKAIAEPGENGNQKSYTSRVSALTAALGSSGNIPSVDDSVFQMGNSTLKQLTTYGGEVSARGRNIEMQFFPGLVNQVGIAIAGWAGFVKVHEPFNNPLGLFWHRTDNPAVFPFTRSQSVIDGLLALNGQTNEDNLGALPGHCVSYDQGEGHGLPGAMGLAPIGNFGLLSKVHPDILDHPTLLANANERKCLKGGGSLYPLTNFVAGGENFKGAFYTRFLRMSKLINLYSSVPLVPKAPMFHQYPNYGSKFQSKLQVHEASFESSDKLHPIDEDTLDSHWTNEEYDNRREAPGDSEDGLNLDIAHGNMWVGIDACPRGYTPFIVFNENWTQIRGNEKYTG